MLDFEEAMTREFAIPSSVDSFTRDGRRTPPNPSRVHYNTSAHFLWIGDRTRQLDGAHVEYFRGIRNPIGVKVGPSMKADELVRLLDSEWSDSALYRALRSDRLLRIVVNPDREEGKVTLITRYGAGKVRFALPLAASHLSITQLNVMQVEEHLPGHIRAVQASGHPVIWICDPMHGNTVSSTGGLKTRNFGTIISELTSCLRVHADCDSHLNGVSLEFTG